MRQSPVLIKGKDGTDVYFCGAKFLSGLTDSQLRAYGWKGDLRSYMAELLSDFSEHIQRLELASNLVTPNIRLKMAKDVLAKLVDAFSALEEYGFGNVSQENPITQKHTSGA